MEDKQQIEYPFEYNELDPEETKDIEEYFNSEIFTTFIRLGSVGYFFYKEFSQTALDAYNLPLRSSDIFVLSYPRSGTTMTQELVWLIQNNLNYEKAAATPLHNRFPFLESEAFSKLKFPQERLKFQGNLSCVTIDDIRKSISPRYLKSHMPMSLLPPSLLDTAKVVYVARDPRDVAYSNFLQLQFNQFIPKDGTFKQFWKFFIESKVRWCPYFDHVKEAWRLRNHPNMTLIFYEELIKDLPAVARRVAKFFGKDYSDKQIETLCSYLSFDNFKNNASVNMEREPSEKGQFIRKGKSGGWREHFDAEMTQQAETWIADNLRDTDLRFPHFE